ncbi:zinc finger FYVE domain-containing protein 9 [Pontoporia blainvillei]|uniref:Zinc finger FYVE domain-containing protein 9 n=1 Tax=Pontoporia blainvillei TaxID=48723 RepID=A0ABX0S839_PONBL|nr:zinc finger FYVE domain-containing protein 9 [Pontoporia blainvillei]
MGTRYFLALFLILLVLGFEVQGDPVPRQEETASPALLTKVQESLLGYWDLAKAAAQKLYKKTYLPAMDEKISVISPIDGKSMESITSVKIFHGSEYKANGKVIRWTEVFFLENDDQHSCLSDPADHSRLTEHVAKAFCLALCPHLKLLKEDGMTKLGLRVTLDSDQVGYQAGSNGQPLPSQYMNDLDSALVPVIHGGACQLSEGPIVMELIFYILENIA